MKNGSNHVLPFEVTFRRGLDAAPKPRRLDLISKARIANEQL